MRKIFAILSVAFACISATAQDYQTISATAQDHSTAPATAQDYPTKGYRGFVEFGAGAGFGDNGEFIKGLFSTSHGCQINRLLFVGGGLASNVYVDDSAEYYYEDEGEDLYIALPLFANVRFDFAPKKISSFIDVKMGASVAGDITGLYMGYTVGVRFNRFNLGAGLDLQSHADFDDVTYKSINFKLGFDFGARK